MLLKINKNVNFCLRYQPHQGIQARDYNYHISLSSLGISKQKQVKVLSLISPMLQVYNLLTIKDLTYFPENLDQQEEEQASYTYPYNIGNEVLSIPVANYDEEDIYSFLKVESLLFINVLAYETLNVSKTLYT